MPWWEHLFHPSVWDWGDVATWFTGIITTLTLALGFYLLLRDRRKEEMSQARQVFIWSESFLSRSSQPKDQPMQQRLKVTVWNRSMAPIHLPLLHGLKDQTQHFAIEVAAIPPSGDVAVWLQPDAKAVATLMSPNRSRTPVRFGATVTFVDINGLDWEYTVDTRTLKRPRSKGNKGKYRVRRGTLLKLTK